MCSRAVFRCFRWMEKMGDRITGAAGPFFVGLAIILMSVGVVAFFDVIQPSLSWPIASLPITSMVAVNMLAHYYYACTVRPGFVDDAPRQPGKGFLWARKRSGSSSGALTGVQWSSAERITKASITTCRKCGQRRPERAHHCRVCNRCVLKYDHHCPVRINQCVGLHNERHFVLFMVYLVVATCCFGVLGYESIWKVLSFSFAEEWSYRTPSIAFALVYVVSVVLCLAVGVMLLWHLWSVAGGETSVENHDHEVYKKMAKERGESFENSYDLGVRKNFEYFFNIGRNGYPLYTLILPLRIMPYTDGRAWARREGYDRHAGVKPGEELTDEDEDDE
ncbi:zf-DHHC-domain-containing protein [Rickenella mellea]|uniref:Palmitoyltransferase n=1 Tax=Rickenella mellea TaxID=50990 RepID=A0A4Y7PZE9_9AGAM|nr:zf-DHHC-domain-containing protein [Rickenella mellea]